MEPNVVIIPLYDYLKLKEFREKVSENYVYISPYNYGKTAFITNDEAVINLANQCKSLEGEISNWRDLVTGIDNKRIDYFKKLSIWGFIKFKYLK